MGSCSMSAVSERFPLTPDETSKNHFAD